MIKKLIFSIGVVLGVVAPAKAVTYPQFKYVQISTDTTYTPSKQNGNVNIATATVGGLTVTSSETIQGPLTAQSSATVQGNFSVGGTINAPTTATSSMTVISNLGVYGVFQATGPVLLGSSGNNVQMSSNTIVPGTTFYQNGLASFSNGKKAVCTVVATSSATTTTAFADTGLTVSITPIGGNVEVWAGGTLDQSTTADSDASLARGASSFGFTNLGAAQGFCEIEGVAAGGIRAPCFMYFTDASATAGSSNTYRVIIRSNNSGTTTWGSDSTTNYICAKEVF